MQFCFDTHLMLPLSGFLGCCQHTLGEGCALAHLSRGMRVPRNQRNPLIANQNRGCGELLPRFGLDGLPVLPDEQPDGDAFDP